MLLVLIDLGQKTQIYSLKFRGKVLAADSEQAEENFSRQEENSGFFVERTLMSTGR